ncbi:MAG: xanthine dehydrogenase YagS FAD-binding subunit [Acidobacteriaceae bacterium]|jgi:xanthine dehydrogenase YagS FAD-binding subunit|nr:xanthine dehydrogenase YagS FAD-binding subunit [Acidobacteriaceae bacterium]
MNLFSYERARDVSDALRLIGNGGGKYLGGGTNLVDLMREALEKPAMLVDVTGLS